MDGLIQDLRYAVRTLRKARGFAAIAVLTLALGIGASTAIFSVTYGVLLRPLPYNDPSHLVIGYADLRQRANYGMQFSTENFLDIRNGTTGAFDGMAAVFTQRQVLAQEDGTPEQIRVGRVTTNFFRLMGARIIVGRDFEDADGEPQPQPPQGAAAPSRQDPLPLPTMVILSYEFWQRRYGGRTDIVGRDLTGGPARGQQIVGVLAPGFELPFPPADNMEHAPDVWLANRLVYNNANRNTYWLRVIARLKPNVTIVRAQADVEAVADQIRRNFPLYRTAGFYARLEPMHKALVEPVRPAILALMGAALVLLVIACANIASLLLVRAAGRGSEFAMRAALGARRWCVVRQMLAESVLITALGTTFGVLVAWIGIRGLLDSAPANLPRLDSVRIDAVVLAVTVLTALVVAVTFGLVPAGSAFRADVTNALRSSSRTSTRRLGRLRSGVVTAEVALSFVLLIGSGLMVRSFVELQRVNPGFDPHGVLTFQLLGGRGAPTATPAQRAAYTREIEERLRAIPGVQSVTASFPFPLAGDFSTIRWGTAEALADNSKYQAVDWQVVRPGYFETIRTPLIEGRTFTDADNDPRRNVVVVDQVLAAKAFPHQSAVGKRILIRIRTPEPEWVEVIGVVAHQRVTSLADPGREQLYFTDGFVGFGARKWAIRTGGDAAQYAGTVRAALARLDSQLLVTDLQPMDALVWRAQASTRFSMMLIGVFGAIAALLVAVGLYGVLSTAVRQRTSELGVRIALGASAARIVRDVVGQGLCLTAIGIAVGVPAAVAFTRVMTTMLVGVTPTDPPTFASGGVLFFVIAGISSWLPARRAAHVDPVIALRSE